MKNQMQTIEASAVQSAVQSSFPQSIHRRLTAREFKAVADSARSLLGQAKNAPEIVGLAAAIRHEERAQLSATVAAVTSGMAQVGVSKSARVRLTASGSVASASVAYSRLGTDAETVDACRAILGKPAPDANASEGTRTQYHARQRLARARLCKLDAAFALEEAERLADAAIEYAESLRRAA